MTATLFYTVFGYLCGSILFSRIYAILFHQKDSSINAADHNPGVANAFSYGGFSCGLFTLAGDLSKGIIPVYLYCRYGGDEILFGLPFVLAAPVIGHLVPLFFHFRGGKGIAATFGSYLGCWFGLQIAAPALILAALFLFFALIVPIHPNLYLTAIVYTLHPIVCSLWRVPAAALYGSVLISLCVLSRLALSKEKRGKLEVRFLWKR